jgi:hypothetical protein
VRCCSVPGPSWSRAGVAGPESHRLRPDDRGRLGRTIAAPGRTIAARRGGRATRSDRFGADRVGSGHGGPRRRAEPVAVQPGRTSAT